MQWFRWYSGTRHKKTWRALTPEGRCLWQALLEMANELDLKGIVHFAPGIPLTEDQLADEAKITVKAVRPALELLKIKEWIQEHADHIFVTDYADRQFLSDLSTERTRKYRDRMKAIGDGSTNGYLKHKGTVHERDKQACVYCGGTAKLCIDHSIPVILGGDDHPDNLVTACKSCNSGKAGRTPQMAGFSFINKVAEERFRRNELRLREQSGTVPVTLPEYRVQNTDYKEERNTMSTDSGDDKSPPEKSPPASTQKSKSDRPKPTPKPEPTFGDDARTLATTIYDHLKADNALPASQSFFVKQAIAAERLLTKRPLEEWVQAFQWALTESFHRQKMTNLTYLGDVVMPQFALRTKEGNASVGDGRNDSGSTGANRQEEGVGTGRNRGTTGNQDARGVAKKRSEFDDLSVRS